MNIANIKQGLVEAGIPLTDIRVKYSAGKGPHVCILTKGMQYTCAAAPIDDESDDKFVLFLISERNKALSK